MALKMFCDECKTEHYTQRGRQFADPPPGWVEVSCSLRCPEPEPESFDVATDLVTPEGAMTGKTTVKLPLRLRHLHCRHDSNEGVMSDQFVLCPRCAEPRMAGLLFARGEFNIGC